MKERRRNEIGCRGDDDLVERGVLGPAVIAVADFDLDIAHAVPVEPLLRLARELFNDFDAVDLACELTENRGLVAETGSDLEHHIIRREIEQICHERNNERLRDGFFESDRKRNIGVGIGLQLDRHEFVSRHLVHGRHDPFGERCLADGLAHMKHGRGDFGEHTLTQEVEIFHTHYAVPSIA